MNNYDYVYPGLIYIKLETEQSLFLIIKDIFPDPGESISCDH